MSMFSEVSVMNTAFNNIYGRASLERLTKQCNCIPEEISELKEAHAAKDEIKVRDALCDVLVFTFGAFHLMGIDYDTLVGASYPRRLFLSDGNPNLIDNAIKLYDTQLGPALTSALNPDTADEHTIVMALLGVVDFALGMYNLFGQDQLVEEDMHAVYVSNMSKFCADQSVLEATVAKYEDLGVMVRSEGSFPTMCVKACGDQDVKGVHYPDGKFLKSTTYKEPVFA